MEDFIVNEKEIELPSSWEDVSWEKFLGFSKLIEKFYRFGVIYQRKRLEC